MIALLDDRLDDYTLVSEEIGEVVKGSGRPWLVLDPIDGSLNAKRGVPHFCLSLAVADGPTMKDVTFGYVYDFGTGEEWTARRGEGAWLDGVALGAVQPKDEIELLAFEATLTSSIAEKASNVVGVAHRLRVMGSLALALCNLAAGRIDGVCSLKGARSVDIAAAQLLVREVGLAIDLFEIAAVRRRAARPRAALARRRGGERRALRPPGRSTRMSEVRIGCSGWNYQHWRNGVFYPPRLPASKWLQFYAEHFDTVEVNATFYRLPRPTAVANWVALTPPDFVLTIKMSRYVTHVKRLAGVKESLRALLRDDRTARRHAEARAGALAVPGDVPSQRRAAPRRARRAARRAARVRVPARELVRARDPRAPALAERGARGRRPSRTGPSRRST